MSVENNALLKFNAPGYIPRMSVICKHCGGPHPFWECTAPAKTSAAARKDVPSGAASPKKEVAAGTQAPHVDTNFVNGETIKFKVAADPKGGVFINGKLLRKRGRPKTILDMKAYKADKAKEYRAKKKAQEPFHSLMRGEDTTAVRPKGK